MAINNLRIASALIRAIKISYKDVDSDAVWICRAVDDESTCTDDIPKSILQRVSLVSRSMAELYNTLSDLIDDEIKKEENEWKQDIKDKSITDDKDLEDKHLIRPVYKGETELDTTNDPKVNLT